MANETKPPQICPYLALANDRDSRFLFPEGAHRCYATDPETTIILEHQGAICFSEAHTSCPRFIGLSSGEIPAATSSSSHAIEASGLSPEPDSFGIGRIILWGVAIVLVTVTIFYYATAFFEQRGEVEGPELAGVGVVVIPTATPTIGSVKPVYVDAEDGGTPESEQLLPSAKSTPTTVPDGRVYNLSPEQDDIGWVVSGEDKGNHFGDSFLYAGIFEGQIYQSAFQIDLSPVPRGAPIHHATIKLTGLREEQLGQRDHWTLRLLASEDSENWRRQSYQDIFNAATLHTLNPVMGSQDLAEGKENTFELSPAQIRILEERLIDNEDPVVSFRVDGPLVGSDNLFAWDTGYGQQTQDNKVVLSINAGPPPATPPLYDYIVVTSTPTPDNVVTAAAIVMEITAMATRIGTATPVPPNVVTATPIPDHLVIVPTAKPENTATANRLMAEATANAQTTGTPTPFPTDAVTATSTPSNTPTPTATSTATFVLVTATPNP